MIFIVFKFMNLNYWPKRFYVWHEAGDSKFAQISAMGAPCSTHRTETCIHEMMRIATRTGSKIINWWKWSRGDLWPESRWLIRGQRSFRRLNCTYTTSTTTTVMFHCVIVWPTARTTCCGRCSIAPCRYTPTSIHVAAWYVCVLPHKVYLLY